MTEELKSEGRCIYCNQMFSQKEIGKHLAKHLVEMEKKDADKTMNFYYHIEVQVAELFLHLLVRGDATMKIIDDFLREIWLECCGHMSEFGHKNFRISKRDRVEDIFAPRVKNFHDYDFGSTTRVFLKGLKSYRFSLKGSIILLSRNEPLKLLCNMCKKNPAVNLCATCSWEEDAFYCEACSGKHAKVCEDFADYSSMPVVNSPRMGVCGYMGGSIDLERDGGY